MNGVYRNEIYEKIKNMTPDEETAYFNEIAEDARRKYYFNFIKSVAENAWIIDKLSL